MKAEVKKARVKAGLMKVGYNEVEATTLIEKYYEQASYLSKVSDIVRYMTV